MMEKAGTKVIQTEKATYIINGHPFGFIDGTNIPKPKPSWFY